MNWIWVVVGLMIWLGLRAVKTWQRGQAHAKAQAAWQTHQAGLRGEVLMWTYQGMNYWWQEDWDGTHMYKMKDYQTGQYGPPVSEADKRQNRIDAALGAVAIVAAGGAVLTWIGGSLWVVLPGLGLGLLGWLVVIGIEAKRMRDYSRRDWSKR